VSSAKSRGEKQRSIRARQGRIRDPSNEGDEDLLMLPDRGGAYHERLELEVEPRITLISRI